MMLGFIFLITTGHFYLSWFVLLMNILIFREILALKRNLEKEIKIPWFYLLNWYFFAVAVFFFYGKIF
jgi:phosphatidate cytidylyltransferase